MSKVIERVLYNQIHKYADKINIFPPTQSGFRKGFSCTTALLKVTDDIRYEQHKGNSTALVALDFSKAFDTLDSEILLTVLHYWGFSNPAKC